MKKKNVAESGNTLVKPKLASLEIVQEITLIKQEIERVFTRDIHCPKCGRLLFRVDSRGQVVIRCPRCKADTGVGIDF